MFAYEIEVVDTALRPVRGGSVSIAPKGRNQGRPMAYAISAGLARLITLENLVDVVVSAPGFRNALILGVHTDQQVMLEAAITVRLQLADEIALPQPPLYLQAKLVPAGIQKRKRKARVTQIYQDGEWVGSSNPLSLDESNTFGSSREIQIQVSELGQHSVHFEVLKKRSRGGRRTQTLGGGKPRRVQVDAADAGRTFEVSTAAPGFPASAEAPGGVTRYDATLTRILPGDVVLEVVDRLVLVLDDPAHEIAERDHRDGFAPFDPPAGGGNASWSCVACNRPTVLSRVTVMTGLDMISRTFTFLDESPARITLRA